MTHLRLKWAYGFPGDVIAFAAPTVFRGSLFAGSASGRVQALDAKTGCTQWIFEADGPVRMAVVVSQTGANYVALFGDQIGSFYALDARTGRLLWRRKIDEHEATRLTASPAIFHDTVLVAAASWEENRALDPHYPCCTFRGSVSALRISDGTPVWKTYLVEPATKQGVNAAGIQSFGPSGVGIWSAPTVDAKRGVLYVTTGDNYSAPASAMSDSVVALDARSGRIVWSQQITSGDVWNLACPGGTNCPSKRGPDHDFGASAILVDSHGRYILVVGQKSGMVYGLDADQRGAILWQTRVGRGGQLGGIEWGMASDGKRVYAAVSDAVRLAGSATGPAALGASNFDPTQGGGLTALSLDNGERVWFVPAQACQPPRPGCSPAQPAAVSAAPGVVFSGSQDGHLRAFAPVDGHTIWDFDTAREYATVNGVAARGGSLDGAGPVIADGMLYVTSGSSRFGGMPGNVLLAFSAD
jgi:polyvinyl alcohol dehydrogenase (cytochrome)